MWRSRQPLNPPTNRLASVAKTYVALMEAVKLIPPTALKLPVPYDNPRSPGAMAVRRKQVGAIIDRTLKLLALATKDAQGGESAIREYVLAFKDDGYGDAIATAYTLIVFRAQQGLDAASLLAAKTSSSTPHMVGPA